MTMGIRYIELMKQGALNYLLPLLVGTGIRPKENRGLAGMPLAKVRFLEILITLLMLVVTRRQAYSAS